MGFTLFVPDESVRTPSRWIVAYTSAQPRDEELGLQPRITARHIVTYDEDSFTAISKHGLVGGDARESCTPDC